MFYQFYFDGLRICKDFHASMTCGLTLIHEEMVCGFGTFSRLGFKLLGSNTALQSRQFSNANNSGSQHFFCRFLS